MTRTLGTTSTRVFLVRHGNTALNAADRLRGLADPELDEHGIAQATAVARALSDTGIREVVSSPLRRAVVTAGLIAEAAAVPHRIDSGFNDRDYGPWTGHPRADVVREWGSVDDAPGVEERAAVLARALPALDGLALSAAGATVVVVSHDAVIRPLLGTIEPGITASVPTASWAELRHDAGRWRVVSFDNVAT